MGSTGTVSPFLRNPQKLPASDLLALASVSYDVAALNDGSTHEPFGNPAGPGLWHHKGKQLPAYIQQVAHGLVKTGMEESRAIATAVSRCKVWCAGGGGVKPDTKAKACAAVAEWETLKTDSTKAAFLMRAGVGGFNPSLHPRAPAGGPAGGQFAPGSTSAAPTKEKPVAQGQSGKQVSDLQKRLNALGAKLAVDGKFGPKTLAAIRQFQKTHKDASGKPLKVDGLVGPLTTAALRAKPGATVTKPKVTKPAVTKPKIVKPANIKRPTASGLPELVTLPGVDLLAAGTWELSSGRNTFTTDDIAEAIKASQCPAVGPPVIKLGHVDPRFNASGDNEGTPLAANFDGQPAIGRVTNLRSSDSGHKLVGDLSDMPGWLAAISASAFPRRSIEGSYGFKCQIGHDHPFVLTGLALLGVTAPGVGVLNSLPDIASLYGLTASEARDLTGWVFASDHLDQEGTPMAVTEEDVRRAYYANAKNTWWITELQMVPTQLIVAGDDGQLLQVPFTLDGGDISFGDATPLETYADLAAARGTGHLVTYASAEESRDGFEPEDPDEVDASGNGWTMRDGKQVWDPDNDGDDDSTAAGDTDNSHFDSDGKMKPGVKIPPKPAKAGASDAPTLDGDNKTGNVNNASMSADHGPMTGTHSHPHAANGTQGGDDTHSHTHTHSGDADHGHTHAANDRKGGSDVEFTTEHEASLRAAMGLGEGDALTPEAILNAVTAKGVKAGRFTPPAGVIAIEQEVWDNLNRKVEAATAFQQKVLRNERDEVIDKAIRDGKFSAARRTHWAKMWDADPESTREVMAGLTRNSVPVNDIGSPNGALDEDLDREFAGLYPPGTFKAQA